MTRVTLHFCNANGNLVPFANIRVSLHNGVNPGSSWGAINSAYIIDHPDAAASPMDNVLLGVTVGDVSPETVLVGEDKGYRLGRWLVVQGTNNPNFELKEVEVILTEKGEFDIEAKSRVFIGLLSHWF